MDTRKETRLEPAAADGGAGKPGPTGAKPATPAAATPVPPAKDKAAPEEIGGRPGPDPTRYGDWEIKGRCIDF